MLAYNLNCWLMLFNREEEARVATLKHTTLATARLRFLFLAAKISEMVDFDVVIRIGAGNRRGPTSAGFQGPNLPSERMPPWQFRIDEGRSM